MFNIKWLDNNLYLIDSPDNCNKKYSDRFVLFLDILLSRNNFQIVKRKQVVKKSDRKTILVDYI